MAGAIPSNINPNTTSGTDLANILNLFKDAFASTNSGTSRPANIQVGGLWWDTTNILSFLIVLKMYDGADDITMLTLNISTNTVSISDSDSVFRITKISNDAVGPLLKLIKERTTGGGQAQNGDTLGAVQFIGEDNGGLFPVICEIKAVASDNVTPTAQGGYLVFSATDDATGTMLEKMRLVDGKLGIGVSTVDSVLHVLGALGARVQSALTDNAVGALFTLRKKRTANSGKILSGDDIGKISFNSTDDAGAEITDAVSIEVSAVENHTSTAHGSQLKIYVQKATQATKTLMVTIADTITVAVATTFSALVTFAGDLKIKGASVTNYVTLQVPAALAASYTFIFPPDVGTNGYVLTKDPGGGTVWTAIVLTNETRNEFLNSQFGLWERATTSQTIANAAKKYTADMWCARNILGTNGVLTNSRIAAVNDGALFGNKLQITTAPTSGQTNGCELYYAWENSDSMKFYNKTCSVNCKVKSFGNVNQVGIQFMYATSETIPTTGIGSETLVTVNTSTFVDVAALAKALGTSMTTAGVVGVRIRITAVSSGNTYDLNNGFVVEVPTMNTGSTAMAFSPREQVANELMQCQRRFNGRVIPCSAVGFTANEVIVAAVFNKMRAFPSSVTQINKIQVAQGSTSRFQNSTTFSFQTASDTAFSGFCQDFFGTPAFTAGSALSCPSNPGSGGGTTYNGNFGVDADIY